MNRNIVKTLLAIALALSYCTSTRFNAVSAAERPNFVWLISEDNSKHFLKLFDETGAETPNIEKMAKHGLIFERAFSNAPVCSVARTTLITSCYAPRIGTQYHRRAVMAPMPDGLKMFPFYLRQAGYYTTNKRKTDYNAIPGKGVWDESSNKASWRKRKKGQSFFHKQSFGTSHEGTLHFSRTVFRNEKTKTDPQKVFVPPHHPKTEIFKYTYARYHDRIQMVDQQIGQIFDMLHKDGVLEDTFIFYFGDHGGVLPRGKGYAYETGLHIPLVVRVPKNFKHLVDENFGDDDFGKRVSGFVSFVDFGPTLLKLAGAEIPKQIDGKPFLGKGVTFDEVNKRQTTFGYADRFDEKYDLVRTWRKGKYKYVRNFQPFNFDALQNNYRYRMLAYTEWRDLYNAGKLNKAQKQFFEARAPETLYDLESDPYEVNNLAGDSAHREKLIELREELTGHLKKIADLSFIPESVFVKQGTFNPVKIGKQYKSHIGELIDIADLSLGSFEKAKADISAALDSKEPLKRYWALIACSSFGDKAKSFVEKAKAIANRDSNNLVRVRAAEFLGLIGAADPAPFIMKALAKAKNDGVEVNLILNSLVLLRDGKHKYKFDIDATLFDLKRTDMQNVARRVEYLTNSKN